MKSNEEIKDLETKTETEKPIVVDTLGEEKETDTDPYKTNNDLIKEEKNIDYENLRKEFEKLKTEMNEIQKSNLKLQSQNVELHKKIVNEAIEPSEKVDNVVEYNAFDPSTWPSNRSKK